MKWKNEVPNKFEFMKINSQNFIINEKLNSELEHEKNLKFLQQTQRRFDEQQQQQEQPQEFCEKKTESGRIMSETITLTQSKTDFTGTTPRRYTTTCLIKPITTPIWYTESLFLTIGSTKRTYKEQVYFKNRLYPFYWSENMQTEVKTNPKCITSEFEIPVAEEEYHYLSLIPQQKLETTTL